MIDKSKEMYDLIHKIDCNVAPYVLTLGSILFKFIKQINKDLFIIEPLMAKEHLKNYFLYSEENLCKTYNWLKENDLIYYSSSLLKYCLTDKALRKLNIV